jgi:hypothetical protein
MKPVRFGWCLLQKRVLRPLLLAGSLAGAGAAVPCTAPQAQGISTVAIRGTVRMADSTDPEGARVVVRNTATGFAFDAEVRRGRFLVQGLETGGPYTITVRRIGALAKRWDRIVLTLGEPLELDVTLEPAPVQLDSVIVVSAGPAALSCCDGGTATTLPDSLVHKLPSLNRNVYDFLRLVPQISTRIGFAPGGISGGGVGFRLNSFLTNGVSERSLSGSQPPEFSGGKSLPFEAVREYQVLLAPFDVRYGDFAGAMVNTVTRSGSNRLEGSVFGQWRNDRLARGDLPTVPYNRWQSGASLSGPIVRDRLHFLVATEFQRLETPMVGPFVGQPDGAAQPVPVSTADLDRLDGILGQYGLEAGSAGAVENRNRINSVFARLDAGLAGWNSRAVLWLNYSDLRDRSFSRQSAPEVFELSSAAGDQAFDIRTLAAQLYTGLRRRGGGHNELSVSLRSNPVEIRPGSRQPTVQVTVPGIAGGLTTVVSGTGADARGGAVNLRDIILRDNLTLPLGSSHVASVGLEAEWFRIGPLGLPNASGTWDFLSLDSLAAGQAERYELARDFGSSGVPVSGGQFAAYAGDYWRISGRFSLTLGLRADLLAVSGPAPYNRLVDSLFSRRTDQPPPRSVHLSPRIGFTWDVRGTGRSQVRGGLGIFTGRPPLAWYHAALRNYGEGTGNLRCGVLPGDLGAPPPFSSDPANPPLACAGGVGVDAPPPGDVALLAADLRMARTLRGVLAYERRLPGDFTGTLEALVTRNLSDFAFVNLNLVGPQATDGRGRVLYGVVDSLGRGRPVRVTDSLPGVIELQNVSRNHSVQLSASLARQFNSGISAMASYTWSRVRDVQTPLRVNNRGVVNWGLRAVSGRHEDLSTGISLNDVPHRLVLAGTWRAPWRRWLTELSALYVGESGNPFTWRTGGIGGRGDLNADGAQNDPLYVPLSALDLGEIVFTGVSAEPGADNSPAAQEARVLAQRSALEQFIEGNPCMRRQRGRILETNSCREPWAHTTAMSLRQIVPIGGHALEAQVDLFNPLNLLDGDWGRRRLANPVLLEHVGHTPGASGQREPVFRFVESSAEWTIDPTESAFQLQFGVRYRF